MLSFTQTHTQSTVLTAVLFVINISDIDENGKKFILRRFTDFTRAKQSYVMKIKNQMQKDLESIHKWTDANKMLFNANKFEQYRPPSGDPIVIKDS